jgi:shikimate dehydrogenase
MSINGHTLVAGILGWPVSHSLSPNMHNAALAHHKINGVYVPLPCQPENLAQAIEGLRVMNFVGSNLTIPHKEMVLPLLDKLDPVAEYTGSVNTIYKDKEGLLCGTTTDPYGAFANLFAHGYSLKNQHLVILGNGGAARALAFTAAADYGSSLKQLTILGRNSQKVEDLVQSIRSAAPGIRIQSGLLKEFPQLDADIVINTTPVGMHPHENESPLKKEWLKAETIIYDIVYAPLMTKLLNEAQERGCKIVTGIGMLIHQGALSFEKWFGISPNIDIMTKAVQKQRNS